MKKKINKKIKHSGECKVALSNLYLLLNVIKKFTKVHIVCNIYYRLENMIN